MLKPKLLPEARYSRVRVKCSPKARKSSKSAIARAASRSPVPDAKNLKIQSKGFVPMF